MTEENLTEIKYDDKWQPIPYTWEVPFWYEIYDFMRENDEWVQYSPQLRKCDWTPEEKIKQRVIYLRIKLIDWTITPEEKEELKLLI